MKREELLKSKEYWLGQIQNDLFSVAENYMLENKLTKVDFAKELHVTTGYVRQILNGDFNNKIGQLVDVAMACGKVPVITFVDLEKHIEEDAKQ